jgi:hypothetical protein
MSRHSHFLVALATAGLAGCGGLAVPAIQEPWDTEVRLPGGKSSVSATAQIELEIKLRVYCDLREAVHAVQRYTFTDDNGKVIPSLPANWGASVAIMLQVDESVALNPGVAFNDVLPNAIMKFGPGNTVTTGQSFSLGFGGTLSSTATRIDKFNPYYTIKELSKPFAKGSSCLPGNDPYLSKGVTPASSSPFILESDLGIKNWLRDATYVNRLIPSDKGTSAAGSAPKVDTISYEIKFVIVSNGNVTPAWKLVKLSANTGNTPFFSTGRTRTHDLIITIGPNTADTKSVHQASLFAAGVNSALRPTGQ